ncbi:hypothetical protein Igag_0218 [Ignisphaera aggregans DSM 17230]|uniref:Uncharacterized protein n=1 Tax=Ignisphaera aggregans (strain DSM 17230 / JCM 13409 / AQ1.S1) TaxID=583356 RepID=E0SQB7_IGNAA|nr:hypothetical protein Igag_0218 [Ignisphaera aggregans DSM 17230]
MTLSSTELREMRVKLMNLHRGLDQITKYHDPRYARNLQCLLNTSSIDQRKKILEKLLKRKLSLKCIEFCP